MDDTGAPRGATSPLVRRPREAVLGRGPHAAQWLAAAQEGAPGLRLGVGQWPGRRADQVKSLFSWKS